MAENKSIDTKQILNIGLLIGAFLVGKKLLETAENISKTEGYNKIAIISGTGVRNYYRKNGYDLIDTYMIKII